MEKTKKHAKIWLCVSIALMVISMVISSVIQTDFGKVKIKQLYVETDDGWGFSCNLYVPQTATADNPAPAVVTSHGSLNNKEMQDANYVELARRGYVVIAGDMSAHGDSEIYDVGYSGVWSAVQILSRLPYVDHSRIGITGHSAGGGSCTKAVTADKDGTMVAAVLYNSADATYTDSETGEFTNIYGERDVGIISCKYDEFFHTSTAEDGTKLPSPFYMETDKAQSFLYFGADPAGLEVRVADTIYRQEIDGQEAIRVIYRPEIIHPWSHFSARSTKATIEFFEETLGAPNPIPSDNQIWFVKECFNFAGVIGLVLFLINFTILMVFTPYFSGLRAADIMQPIPVRDKQGKLWFWGTLIASALFSSVVYLPILKAGTAASFVSQTQVFGLGCWSAACGIFAILLMFLSYKFYGKKHGYNLTERGVKISASKLGKTVLLAFIVAGVTYGWVFIADYFFKTDFRFWTLAFKTFQADKLYIAAFPYLELFLVFYLAASVSANAFNYNDIGGKSWVNTAIVALFTAAPALVLPWIQYGVYFSTDFMAWGWTDAIYPMWVLWLFPIVLILIGATVVSRLIYKVTGNPYLAGIINALIVTIISCANTSTKLL